MKKKIIKTYLARAKRIIGARTPGEIAHDDSVCDALNQRHRIEMALATAVVREENT